MYVIYNLNGVHKICHDWSKYYIGQTKQTIKRELSITKNAYIKPHVFKPNLATQWINKITQINFKI